MKEINFLYACSKDAGCFMYTFNVLDPISQEFAWICAKVDLIQLYKS